MSEPPPTAQQPITVDDLRDLFGELRAVAAGLLDRESKKNTFTPTALAVTALRRAKLKDQDWETVRWENRAHFFSALVCAMRNAIIDHARRRHAKGRDRFISMPPDEGIFLDLPTEAEARPDRVLQLEDALTKLEEMEPLLAERIQQHFFAGYTVPEIARFAEVSENTIDRQLKRARVLLQTIMVELAHSP